MTSKFAVVSMVLGLAAGASAMAQTAGGNIGGNAVTERGKSATKITMPVYSPNATAAPLTDDYGVLDEESIFSRYHEKEQPATQPTKNPEPGPKPVGLARVVPVFRGVMVVDSGTVALMEMPNAKGDVEGRYVREGDALGGATVLCITFETLRLSRTPAFGGQVPWVDVPIGCNLDGVAIGALPVASSASAAGNQLGMSRRDLRGTMRAPTGAVQSLASTSLPVDAPLPAGSADDLAGRMALRRQMQLRGGGEVGGP
jgi:hypothetical protein